jgi:hypothetical protein
MSSSDIILPRFFLFLSAPDDPGTLRSAILPVGQQKNPLDIPA